jgi:hypothetical protein
LLLHPKPIYSSKDQLIWLLLVLLVLLAPQRPRYQNCPARSNIIILTYRPFPQRYDTDRARLHRQFLQDRHIHCLTRVQFRRSLAILRLLGLILPLVHRLLRFLPLRFFQHRIHLHKFHLFRSHLSRFHLSRLRLIRFHLSKFRLIRFDLPTFRRPRLRRSRFRLLRFRLLRLRLLRPRLFRRHGI